jgi:hypothetical protein
MEQQAESIDRPLPSTGSHSRDNGVSVPLDYHVTAIYIVIACVAIRLALYLCFGPQYGYFRDEMYYLACGRHPQWSYGWQPPRPLTLIFVFWGAENWEPETAFTPP